ncbi:MAG TPA: LamG-like jellyroll fold domain-containing protein [Pyrinomonadaceae bacterium]|nr:LamG-like jellyroll fold domain-containing protein [Pyrinomonadaceae bacterium]
MAHFNKKTSLNRLTPVLLVILLTVSAVVTANASVSTFTGRTFYNNAVSTLGTTKNIDFLQKDNGTPITNPNTDTYIDPLLLKGVTFNGARSYYNLNIYTGPNGIIRATLPPNTYAFGVDLTRFYGTNGTFTITLSTGDVYQLPGNAANNNFLGFYSDEPLQWAEYSYNTDYLVLDNFTFTIKTPNQLSGLVSYWTGDNHALDVKANNDGTPRGGTTYASGFLNQAFSLDGVSRYVEVPDSPSLSLTGAMTLEAKIRLNTNTVQQAIIEKYDVPGVNGYLLRVVNGKLEAAMCNATLAGAQQPAVGATTVSTGEWHHVAAVYDGTTIKIYLDGVLDGSVNSGFAPTNGSASLKIGARGDDANTRLNGLIDEVRIFNRALSAAEVQSLVTNDSTPPVITPQVTGNLGSNDWYTGNVQINWTVTDGESSVSNSNGCGISNVTGDTSGVTFTCTATSTGGTATQSVTIKRDASAPEINASANAGGNPYTGGWTNQDVVVSFDCYDALSGVAFQTDPLTLADEGANQSAAGSCTDAAGNSSETTFSDINIDKTAPEINAARTPAANGAGWNNTDVTANYTASDALSGLSVNSPANGSYTFSMEGAAQTHTFTVTDAAGNSASATVQNVNIDKTAPSISCAAADGSWHAADVSINCTATENISSLADSSDANFNLVTSVAGGSETSNASTDSRQVCDVAGNCATGGSVGGNKVDKKGPSITITAPTAGNYLLNQAVTVSYSCNDGGSGTGNCTGTTANGGFLNTATTGAKTFTVSAVDNVGNTAVPSSVNYTVGFGIDILFDQTKAHKAGSTVPVKIRLLDAGGINVSSAGTVVHALSVVQIGSQASTILDDAGSSNPDFDFRYDQTSSSYIFNLQTKGYSTGTYQLNFIAANGAVVYSVRFQVRQ